MWHPCWFLCYLVGSCWLLNVSNMWLPSSGFLQTLVFKQGSLVLVRLVPHRTNEHHRFGWRFLLEKEVHHIFISEETIINLEVFPFFPRLLLDCQSQGFCVPSSFHLCKGLVGFSPAFFCSLSSFYTNCFHSNSSSGCHATQPYLLPNRTLSNP